MIIKKSFPVAVLGVNQLDAHFKILNSQGVSFVSTLTMQKPSVNPLQPCTCPMELTLARTYVIVNVLQFLEYSKDTLSKVLLQ